MTLLWTKLFFSFLKYLAFRIMNSCIKPKSPQAIYLPVLHCFSWIAHSEIIPGNISLRLSVLYESRDFNILIAVLTQLLFYFTPSFLECVNSLTTLCKKMITSFSYILFLPWSARVRLIISRNLTIKTSSESAIWVNLRIKPSNS